MLNCIILMGRLTANPELKHTPNNISVTRFTLAVNRTYVKAGQDRQADFIDIVAWRSTAEFICKYFSKGQLAAIQGSLQVRNYTDKEGIKRKAVEVIADNVYFAEPKRDLTNSQPSPEAPQDYPSEPSFESESDIEDLLDDDLPF